MPGPTHFEIYVDDIERAKAFYGAAFGWTFEDFSQLTGSPYWGIVAGAEGEPGINGGLLERSGPAPAPGSGANAFVCTMEVADYDDTERKILAAGGEVAVPRMALPGMAWQGYYLDPEGNTFGLHQPDAEAR